MSEKRRFKPTVKRNTNVPSLFHGWKEWNEGDYVIGKYHSSFESEYRGQKSTNYRVEVLECSFTVTTKDGTVVDPVGEILVLNSAGQLNKLMEEVKVGMLVHVEYGGKKPGKDGTLYHTFATLEAGEAEGEDDEAYAAGEAENGL